MLSLHYFLSATCKRVTIFSELHGRHRGRILKTSAPFVESPFSLASLPIFAIRCAVRCIDRDLQSNSFFFFADVKYHAKECLRCCNFLSQKDGVAARCGARPMRMRRAFSERTHSKPTRARKSGALCNEFGRIRCMKPRCMAA